MAKAKEYFEKYFNDLESVSSAEEFDSLISRFISDLCQEVVDLCEVRKSGRDEVVMSAIKEQNDKWNSVARRIEDKYGRSLLKRNGFHTYVESQFKQAFGLENKENKDDV